MLIVNYLPKPDQDFVVNIVCLAIAIGQTVASSSSVERVKHGVAGAFGGGGGGTGGGGGGGAGDVGGSVDDEEGSLASGYASVGLTD